MKIGLWTDGVNFPSIPLMKISAYHKQIGDTVESIQEGGHYDKAYLSKVFNCPGIRKIPQAPPPFSADEIHKGGTGYAIEIIDGREVYDKQKNNNLPPEMESVYPDYSLYPDFPEAYGFLTRGCPNRCPFCVVSPKEGRTARQVAELRDFWNGQDVIRLLDPNLLACQNRGELLDSLAQTGAIIDFTQGLDLRLIDSDTAEKLGKLRMPTVHFAWDMMGHEKAIMNGLGAFLTYYKHKKHRPICYVLTNFNTTFEEDWYRVRRLSEVGVSAYVMIYRKGTHSRFLTDLSRWCNNPILNNSVRFQDYVPRRSGETCGELYREILKNT